jgi:hypothetical protein
MYVHELQQQGIVALKWVPTDSMLADVLTKARAIEGRSQPALFSPDGQISAAVAFHST